MRRASGNWAGASLRTGARVAGDATAPSSHRDRGFSLVEVTMTIVIMSMVIVPVLNAFIVAIHTSSGDTQRAQVETVLHNAADRVNRAPKSCDYTVYVQAAAQSEGWDGAQATLVEKHYVPGADAATTGSWVAGGCAASAPQDLEVQLVDITVTSPDGSVHRTIEVIKSDI